MIKLEIPNEPATIKAAKAFFDTLVNDDSTCCGDCHDAPAEPTVPPAPMPAGPEPTVPPAPMPANDDVDAEGFPWDERIHSSNRKKTQKGLWTKRKGVQPIVWDEVRAELKATPAQQPMQQPAQQPMQQPAQQPITFPMLIQLVTLPMQKGTLSLETVSEIVGKYGFTALEYTATATPEQLAAMYQELKNAILA